MRALERISFPAEDHNWTIMYSGFFEEVDIWTHACVIQEMKSGTLHVSLNWHLNTGLCTLEKALWTMGQSASILSTKSVSIQDTPLPTLDF